MTSPAVEMVRGRFAVRPLSPRHSRRAAGDDTGACRYPEASVRHRRVCVHLISHSCGGWLSRGAERAVLRSYPEYNGMSAQAGGQYVLSESRQAGAPTCRRQRNQMPPLVADVVDLSPRSVLTWVARRSERRERGGSAAAAAAAGGCCSARSACSMCC